MDVDLTGGAMGGDTLTCLDAAAALRTGWMSKKDASNASGSRRLVSRYSSRQSALVTRPFELLEDDMGLLFDCNWDCESMVMQNSDAFRWTFLLGCVDK